MDLYKWVYNVQWPWMNFWVQDQGHRESCSVHYCSLLEPIGSYVENFSNDCLIHYLHPSIWNAGIQKSCTCSSLQNININVEISQTLPGIRVFFYVIWISKGMDILILLFKRKLVKESKTQSNSWEYFDACVSGALLQWCWRFYCLEWHRPQMVCSVDPTQVSTEKHKCSSIY